MAIGSSFLTQQYQSFTITQREKVKHECTFDHGIEKLHDISTTLVPLKNTMFTIYQVHDNTKSRQNTENTFDGWAFALYALHRYRHAVTECEGAIFCIFYSDFVIELFSRSENVSLCVCRRFHHFRRHTYKLKCCIESF